MALKGLKQAIFKLWSTVEKVTYYTIHILIWFYIHLLGLRLDKELHKRFGRVYESYELIYGVHPNNASIFYLLSILKTCFSR